MVQNLPKPVIFLAFANDQGDGSRYLRKLRDELRRLDTLLRPVDLADRCRVRLQPYATLAALLDLVQAYRDQVAILHYGGHSDSFGLFLETSGPTGHLAGAEGLATFLAGQKGLKLVFLNGCATAGQVAALHGAGVPVVIATRERVQDGAA